MKEFRSSVSVSKARVKPRFVEAKSSHEHLAILWISAQHYTCIARYKPGLDVNRTAPWAPHLVFEMAWSLWDPVALWMCSRMRFAHSTRSRRTPALWSRWREREVILSSSCRPWEASSSGQDSRYPLHNTYSSVYDCRSAFTSQLLHYTNDRPLFMAINLLLYVHFDISLGQ